MRKAIQKLEQGMGTRVEGVGVVEMVLILAVLLGLVVIFRTQLTMMVRNIFSSLTDTVNTLI